MTKEKKELSQEKKDFLKQINNQTVYANWCDTKAWLDGNINLKWSYFYDLLKEGFIKINQVESKFVTSYFITDLGKNEII